MLGILSVTEQRCTSDRIEIKIVEMYRLYNLIKDMLEENIKNNNLDIEG